ncbi:MAG: hypothetical protein M1818_004004 [Claussenomyces sp. TS43310]|nr:MAG: hypothetical protein M1818_004004 [Claussenomyces sp. TS43310]
MSDPRSVLRDDSSYGHTIDNDRGGIDVRGSSGPDHASESVKKRSFSRRKSAQPVPSEYIENTEDDDDTAEGPQHYGKRHRTTDWPLGPVSDDSVRGRIHSQSQSDASNSSSRRISTFPPPRPSRFIEGSMNDRVSQKPPAAYVGADGEHLREQFDTEQNRPSKTGRKGMASDHYDSAQSMTVSSTDDRPEAVRHSSIFRFGKSLAASFNPNNWKLWTKSQQEEQATQEKIFGQPGEKAESSYRDLESTRQLRDTTYTPRTHPIGTGNSIIGRRKHDSGIQLDDRVSVIEPSKIDEAKAFPTSRQGKGYGKVFLDPSNVPAFSANGESPAASEVPGSEGPLSQRRSSFTFRKPSFPTLYGGPNNAKQLAFPHMGKSVGTPGLHRLPSHKDLQKQQRLVKRVSNLEGKLEAARRQLSEALGEPFPTENRRINTKDTRRLHFVPGNLATLPSEGWLQAHAPSDSDDDNVEAVDYIGQAVFINPNANSESSFQTREQDPSLHPREELCRSNRCLSPHSSPKEIQDDGVAELRPLQPTLPRSAPKTKSTQSLTTKPMQVSRESPSTTGSGASRSRKRKSENVGLVDDRGNCTQSEESEDDEGEPQKVDTIVKRKSGRPRKIQKAEQERIPLPGSRSSRGIGSVFSEPLDMKAVTSNRILRNGSPPTSPPQSSFQGSKSPSDIIRPTSKALLDSSSETLHAALTSKSVPPVPQLPKTVRMASGEIIDLRNQVTREREGLPSLNDVDEHGMPYCTACNTKFSSQGRLQAHVRKTCKVLRAKGVYEQVWSPKDVEVVPTAGMVAFSEERGLKEKQSFEWPADVF